MKVETTILNNKEYIILEKINIEKSIYYILINELDTTDICVRKKIVENNEEYLIGLDNEEEFNLIMSTYLDLQNKRTIKKFYPIGTIVKLKDYDYDIMIIGYSMKNEHGEKYDYCGCNYPIGVLGPKECLYFDKENIVKIKKLGFMNKEAKEILTKVEMMNELS